MLFGVGVLDGQGSPAPNGLPRSVKLSVVVLPGRSTLVATSMPPPQPTVLADKLADDVVAAAVARTPYGARILGPLFHDSRPVTAGSTGPTKDTIIIPYEEATFGYL
ncbi:hypothetical protein WN51_03065 [Melipona quadrifasciata]|uniref:Uncharacterized protein n=1 Tax=Melipona quadrifasciata TaxID=166423 RepID=A0A0M8ZZ26_9HYME|nr:hypothetical protein WN51_03065 [Melipona quadrifasciata]